MTNNKYPISQFEEQQFIPEEQKIEQIEEILRKFEQPIPTNFKKLENLKHMCSTQGWKEPVCERYNCLVNSEWKQVDIRYTLLEKLELEAKNIPYPIYISLAVLDKGLDQYFAYNIENEKEIFFQKPLTINNLDKNLTKLFKKLEENQETIGDLQKKLEKTKSDWKNEWLTEWRENKNIIAERDDYQNKWDNSLEILEQKEEIIRSYLQQLTQKGEEINVLNALITNFQNFLEVNDLTNLPPLSEGETLTTLLERPTLAQLNDLEREKEELEREKEQLNDNLNQQIITANNTITTTRENLQKWTDQFPCQTPEQVQNQLNNIQRELEKEKSWWDKWINDNKKSFGDSSYQDKKPYYTLHFEVYCEQQNSNYLPRGVQWDYHGSSRREPGTNKFKEQNAKLALKNLIYEYYKNQE